MLCIKFGPGALCFLAAIPAEERAAWQSPARLHLALPCCQVAGEHPQTPEGFPLHGRLAGIPRQVHASARAPMKGAGGEAAPCAFPAACVGSPVPQPCCAPARALRGACGSQAGYAVGQPACRLKSELRKLF